MKLLVRLRLFLSSLRRKLRRFPPAPDRFEVAARLHRMARPGASAEAWERFAVQLAEDAYWQGVARGFDRARGTPLPEEQARHAWSLKKGRPWLVEALQGRDPADPLRGVPAVEVQAFRERLAFAAKAGLTVQMTLPEPGRGVGRQGRAAQEDPPVERSRRRR